MSALLDLLGEVILFVSSPGQAQKLAFPVVFFFGIPLFLWGCIGKKLQGTVKTAFFGFKLPNPTSLLARTIVGVIGLCFMVISGFGVWETLIRPPPTLKVWTGLSEHELKFFEDHISSQFERIHEKQRLTVDIKNVTWEEVLRRLRAGKEVDLITFDINGNRRALVEFLEDLSEKKEKGLMPSAVHPSIAKYVTMKVKDRDTGTEKKKRYFIPFRPNVRLVFWNRKKFENLKERCLEHFVDINRKVRETCRKLAEPPKTWQDVMVAAKLSRAIEGEERVVVRATDDISPDFLLELIRAADGDPCNLQSSKSLSAVRFLKQLWPYVNDEENNKSRRYDWRTASGFLGSGSVYAGRAWTVSLTMIHEAGKDKDFAVSAGWEWEGASKPSYFLGGELLALPKNARHKDLAKEFMRFLVSRDVQRDIVNALSWPAMRVDAVPTKEWQQNYLEQINEALLHAEPVPDYWSPHMAGIYKNLFARIVDPKTRTDDIDNVLRTFQDEIRKRVGECR